MCDSPSDVPDEAASHSFHTRDTSHARETALESDRDSRALPGRQAHNAATTERARAVGIPLQVPMQQATGGGDLPRRLLVITLDGAVPHLALDGWLDQLRAIRRLAQDGAWGRLQSSLPWTSIPARLCLLSGRDPGQLGVYGPRIPNQGRPAVAVDRRAFNGSHLWGLLSADGKRVGAVGVPATNPAPMVNGFLVSDDLANPHGTFPPELREQVRVWIEDAPRYPLPTEANGIDQIIHQAYTSAEQRFTIARRLLARDMYDSFVLSVESLMPLQRALWDSLDIAHPHYRSEHPFAGVIASFYRFVDDRILELLDLIDDTTIVVVASAYGMQPLQGELALNEWLRQLGELVVRSSPATPAPLEQCDVDWERTRAWADDSGAIYLTDRSPEQCEQTRTRIEAQLHALVAPDSAPAVEVYRPLEIYTETRGNPPDLLVVCRQPGWRPTASLGWGATWITTSTARLDAACESPEGFLLLYDPQRPAGGTRIDDATIYDLVPTLLRLLDRPIPPGLRGKGRHP